MVKHSNGSIWIWNAGKIPWKPWALGLLSIEVFNNGSSALLSHVCNEDNSLCCSEDNYNFWLFQNCNRSYWIFLMTENSMDYLSDKDLVASTNVMFNSKKTFVEELKEYTDQNSRYFVSKYTSDLKRTRSDTFNINDAVEISDVYIDSI